MVAVLVSENKMKNNLKHESCCLRVLSETEEGWTDDLAEWHFPAAKFQS